MFSLQNHCRTVSSLALAAVLLLLIVVAPDVLLIIFAGILVSVFLGGGGLWVSRHTGLSRGFGIALFILLILGVLGGIIAAFSPAIVEQFDQLSREIPNSLGKLEDRVKDYEWGERMLSAVEPSGLISAEGGSAAASAVTSTFGALGNAVIIAFIGLYGAIAPATYRNGLVALLAPSLRPDACRVLDKLGATLQKWLTAQFMSMSVVGVLTGLGLWLIDVPLAFILGLISALLAFIPNIGPVIAAVPALLLALAEGGTSVLLVAGVYIVVQTLESYVITPLIQQERVSLPPALVISAQLLMGVLFGILGLALATPLTAVVMTFTNEVYLRNFLDKEQA